MSTGIDEAAVERLRQPVLRPTGRRRRWPGIVVPAAVLVLLVTAAGAYASHHQPLRSMGWSTFDGGINTIGDGINPTTGFVVDAAPGTRGRMTMDIKNNGPFAVTITGVGHGQPRDSVTAQWVQELDNPPSDTIDPSQLHSLPVTIPPGQQQTLMLSMLSPTGCTRGGVGDMPALEVDSSWLGLRHHVLLPFAAPVYLCAPGGRHYTGNGQVLIG